MKKYLETLIGSIEDHTYNALLNLEHDNNIKIKDFTGEIEHLLDLIRDSTDEYESKFGGVK